ncbi:MFS transporter [Thermogymnomonas acidicola]|uniref:MFS transporter n=1 Tax=Thermogymnomonas acidicola TaxID=399579 RepID=UPI001396BF6C|nr:MFS transporter [Thermogymnomonas acidicola]
MPWEVGGPVGGPVAPLMTAMVAESVERNRTNVYSRLTSLATIAAVAGAAFSSVVSSVVPDYYHLLFLVAMVLNAVSILFSLFLTERRDRVEKATRQDIIPRKSGRNILFISLSGAFGSVGLGMVIPLISLWFKMESLSTPEISVIFDISYIAAAVLVNFSPYFERRIGMINSVVLFRILGSVLLVFIPFLPAMGAAAIYILRTGFYQMALPIRQNFSMTVFAAEERSRGSSLTGLSRRLPYGFATTAGSVLLASGMYLALFLTAGTVSLLDPILYYLFFHGRERRGAVSDAAAAPPQQ